MTIRNIDDTLEEALESAKRHAEQEYASIQIGGHALTEEELRRGKALAKCLEYIEEAFKTIRQCYVSSEA